MLRHIAAFLALPLSGLLAQTPDQLVRVTISSDNNVEFRLVGAMTDSSRKPVMGRARGTLVLSFSPKEALTVFAVDSISQIHIEASENGKLIGTAEGPYVGVLRDSTGSVMVAARGSIPKEPFSFPVVRRP